jgi:uncharacterized GH25 family protein
MKAGDQQMLNLRYRACAFMTAGALFASVATAAAAHDIWIVSTKAGAQTSAEILFGDLVGPVLADEDRIVTFDLVGPAGKTDLRSLLEPSSSHGHPVLSTKPFATTPDAVVAISYDNGFWVTIPGDDSETNTNPLIIPDGQGAHWTFKWGKLLLGPGAYRQKLGARLELVAMSDPFKARPGTTLPVQLLLNGKPFAGADIACTDGLQAIPDAQQPVVKTDANGIAQVPVKQAGPVLLTTDINVPTLHPALAKQDHLFASLSYDTSR